MRCRDDILNLFPGSGQVGAQFGVVLVRDGSSQVEVATFRSDSDYSDGRRPDAVHFERDPKGDVLRRDFTINGLMMDPETGRVLDYVDGRADLDRARGAGHRRRRRALRRRSSAAAARRALRRAAGVRDRGRDSGGHPSAITS